MKRMPTLPMPTTMHELTPLAQTLLVALMRQVADRGNGALCLAPKTMRAYDWWHTGRLQRSRRELVAKGYLVLTETPRRGCAARYAFSWLPTRGRA